MQIKRIFYSKKKKAERCIMPMIYVFSMTILEMMKKTLSNEHQVFAVA